MVANVKPLWMVAHTPPHVVGDVETPTTW
jgi:hypothetical protein